MTETLRISVREERDARSVVRTASFTSPTASRRVFYHVSGDLLPPPLEVYDFAVVAGVFLAMREGRPVHVEGPVTAELLRNLEEFQEAWAMWRPKHRPVRITADQIVPAHQPQTRRGVFAFSGGVDGTFALLRHHGGDAGLRTARPVCAMLVQGFDLPLDNQPAFDRAHAAISEVMGALGIPLATVRTNWRELSKDWLMEYFAGLAACLFQFRGLANVGVSGASEDYSQLIVGLGSNPATNHLLSGGGFQIHTEGGGFTRTQRVRLICDYPEIAARLRVCWEGPKTGENCGHCEKCIRTKLNFLANKREPVCFDRGPTNVEILGLTARTQSQLNMLKEIVTIAKKNGASGPWLSSLRLAIAKNHLMLPARRLGCRIAGKMRPLPGASPIAHGPRPVLQPGQK
jgi:hypothetical protein